MSLKKFQLVIFFKMVLVVNPNWFFRVKEFLVLFRVSTKFFVHFVYWKLLETFLVICLLFAKLFFFYFHFRQRKCLREFKTWIPFSWKKVCKIHVFIFSPNLVSYYFTVKNIFVVENKHKVKLFSIFIIFSKKN